SKNSPERTTGALVSVVAHITPTELRRKLDATEIANGFANRFLFVASTRSKSLPRGGRIPEKDFARLVAELAAACRRARRVGDVGMTDSAWELWDRHYDRLTVERPGLAGEVLTRGPAQV